MTPLVSLATIAELMIVGLAIFAFVRRLVQSDSQAFCYAIAFLFAVFSISIQTFFLLRVPHYFVLFESLVLAVSAALIYRHWAVLTASGLNAFRFFRTNPFLSLLLAVCGIAIFLKGFMIPPNTWDSLTYHLARVLMMQEEGRLFLENFSDYRQDIFPAGYDILHFLFLRFYTDYGLPTFSFLCYTILIVGSYALMQRLYSTRALSKVIALAAASLTMFILHAAMTKNDLVLGAMTTVFLLAAHDYVRRGGAVHLMAAATALLFGVLSKFTFGVTGLFLGLAFLWLLLREHGLKTTVASIARDGAAGYGAPLLLPFLAASLLVVLMAHNYAAYGGPAGPPDYLALFVKTDGLIGAALNIVRFFFNMMSIPYELAGPYLSNIHHWLLGPHQSTGVLWWPAHPVFLEVPLIPPDMAAWFGPLGFPILLSLVYAAFKGDRYLRAVSLAVMGGALFLIVVTGWSPWRGRYYAPLVAVGLVAFGFALYRIKLARPGLGGMLVNLVAVIATANLVFFAIYVPLTAWSNIKIQVSDRDTHYSRIYGQNTMWRDFNYKLDEGEKVLIVTGPDKAIFPLYLRRPDLDITVAGYRQPGFSENLFYQGREWDLTDWEEFRYIWSEFDNVLLMNVPNEIVDNLKRSRAAGN